MLVNNILVLFISYFNIFTTFYFKNCPPTQSYQLGITCTLIIFRLCFVLRIKSISLIIISVVMSKHIPPDNNGPSTSLILSATRNTNMRCIRTKQSQQKKSCKGNWTGPLDPTKIQVRIYQHKNFTHFFPFIFSIICSHFV